METIFPASYSTLSSAVLAPYIEQQFGWKQVQCSLLLRGVGDTYHVRTQEDQFILRVYRCTHRNVLQVQEEAELLMALKTADVPVSYPIEDRSGATVRSIHAAEGIRQAVLFNYAPGEAVSVLNRQQLSSLGREMARFHNVSASLPIAGHRWTFDLEATMFKPLALLENAFAEDRENYQWLQQAADKAAISLSTLDTAAFSYGHCHYDMMPKNFHFHNNSVTFFDFDFMGYGWLANDIMTFWQQLCLDVQFGRMSQQEADIAYAVFTDSYRDHRSLSDKELAAVPYLSLGFWLFYSGFHTTHDQFYTFIQPSHIRQRFRMVRRMLELHWEQ